ncbi:hypothetical protein [Marinoscillum luteum]|uniref:Uncharacterized protein n=1 Tax=Marinoscillum luteum TaxID=861051 RepID=A0ABW7NCG4_9BACT
MFFSRKPKGPTKKYIAYKSKMAKYRNVMTAFKNQGDRRLVTYFFEQTGKEVRQLCEALELTISEPGSSSGADITLIKAYDLGKLPLLDSSEIVCIEVHPLSRVNALVEEAFQHKASGQITYYIGMDEPLFEVFGAERILRLMEQMGMEENEPITHPMISKSLERGMEKLQKTLANPQDIRTSSEEWRAANMPS